MELLVVGSTGMMGRVN